MTKQWIAMIFLLTNLIYVMNLYHLKKLNHYMKKSIQCLIGACCLLTVSYLANLFSSHYIVIETIYSIYFILIGWVCAAIFYYSYCFTEHQKVPKKYCSLVLWVMASDSILQLLYIWFGNRRNYQTLHKKSLPFQFHLIICCFLIGITVLLLVHHIILCAKLLRSQYLALLFEAIALLYGNILFAFSYVTCEYAIYGYFVASILLCCYTFYYTRGQMIHEISEVVIKNISSMVLIFDSQGKLIYKNNTIVTIPINGKNRHDILQELAIDVSKKYIPVVKAFTNKVSGERRFYQISYKQLFGENMLHQQREIGSCLIINDITVDREKLNRTVYLVNHDLLTGIYNKKYFCESSQQMIKENPNVEFAVLMIDIYQFTQYNVCFGTKAGDLILQRVAQDLIDKIHSPLMRYGRYDADRFVICLPFSCCNEAFYKEQGFYDSIQANRFQLVVYSGICTISAEDESLQIVCEHALAALDTIRGSSTKRVAIYNEKMRKQFLVENKLVANFPKAIESRAIVGYIQPQFNQETKQIIGGEVLARWIDQDGSIISPAVFIPVLEKSNLISKLDYYIWEETCRLIQQTKLNGSPIALSVNLSAQDFYYFDIYDVFVTLTERYEVDPKCLRLEITESDVISNIKKQLPLIKKLQAKGFIVEMDDFGSGYSSLNTLKDIPVDVLKMDMKFFEGSQMRGRSQTIVRNVIRMAKELELAVIAEGVETIEQAEFLKSAGCNIIQGYLYGKPMKISEFLKLYYENVNDNKTNG